MTIGTIAPYRSRVRARRDGFGALLRAEWAKFWTVRGWVISLVIAVLAIVGLGLGPSMRGSCNQDGSSCALLTGPGGEPVTDSFYFVRQPLAGNGTITARVTSLTGQLPSFSGPGMTSGLTPWAKAGIIVKASAREGSAYAAMMVTGGHGVRMQYDYTGDIAGLPGAVSAANPRWLRLTRAGDVLTGYDSADGSHWTRVGTVTLPGLSGTVQGGLFAASPQTAQSVLGAASIEGGLSQDTAVLDHVGLGGGWTGGRWTGDAMGGLGQGPAPGPSTGYSQAGGRFTVTGTGDIAPTVTGANGTGASIAQTLIGTFAGLILIVVVGAMFMTAEYRRGLIRVTLAAIPRRGHALAAKAVVIGAAAFAAGLVSSAIVVVFGQRILRGDGVYVFPVTAFTEVRVIVGSAAVLAAAAVLALAIGSVLRRGTGAVAAVIVVTVLPYLLTVAVPVLPVGAADWLLRISPAAGFAVEQTLPQYPQVSNIYSASAGYYPLAPWAGFAVLCAWTALALGLALHLLRRRDA
jgi:ABC-type transport system involved in multi-copper enzyme maturation permease subunit/regulation of enolase protein 1 (concanavalin A-like superfamily)